VKYEAGRARRVIGRLRSLYLAGSLDRIQTGNKLVDLGLTGERINEYLADWDLELKGRRREISAGKILADAKLGLLSAEYAIVRLSNLGYQEEDLVIFDAEIAYARAIAAQKALAKIEAQREKEIRAEIARIKAIKAAHKEAQTMLAKHGSPAQLRKWFCESHIGEDEVRARLHFLDWPDIDIERLIGDCKAPKPPKPPTPTGPSESKEETKAQEAAETGT
jgi:hypothetical protein